MKAPFFAVLFLGLAACGAPPPSSTPAAGDGSSPSLSLAALAGRWALTPEGCATDNAARDGVIEITATSVQVGIDACTAGAERAETVSTGVRAIDIDANCREESGEFGDRSFRFVSSNPDTLTWVKEDGSAEPYARCPA